MNYIGCEKLRENVSKALSSLVNGGDISSSFVETVSWWISQKMQEKTEIITEYFLATIEPILK